MSCASGKVAGRAVHRGWILLRATPGTALGTFSSSCAIGSGSTGCTGGAALSGGAIRAGSSGSAFIATCAFHSLAPLNSRGPSGTCRACSAGGAVAAPHVTAGVDEGAGSQAKTCCCVE